MRFLRRIVFVCGLGLVTSSNAAIQVFNDESDYLEKYDNLTMESFEELSNYRFDGYTAPDFRVNELYGTKGPNLYSATDGVLALQIRKHFVGNTLSFNFNNKISAFGINVIGFGSTGGADSLLLETDLGDSVYLLEDFYAGGFNNQFIGFSSDKLISSFSLVLVPNSGSYDVIFDEAYYGAVSAVPEPSTYALIFGGLGLVGFMARRRNKKLTVLTH